MSHSFKFEEIYCYFFFRENVIFDHDYEKKLHTYGYIRMTTKGENKTSHAHTFYLFNHKNCSKHYLHY